MDTSPAARQPPAFLIVDDEPLARLEMAELVRGCGYSACEAASTAQALALLDAGAEDIFGLITDINMPGNRSGIVLANHVRFIWPHIGIIVVSAARVPLDGALPEHVGFLAKPLRAQALRAAIAGFPAAPAEPPADLPPDEPSIPSRVRLFRTNPGS